MAHAKNDRLFENGGDIDHLRTKSDMSASAETGATSFRVLSLSANGKKTHERNREKDQPQNWDNRVPVVVVPTDNVKDGDLGRWLKNFVTKHRNIVRFLLPKADSGNTFFDNYWSQLGPYIWLTSGNGLIQPIALHVKYQKLLRDQLRGQFDATAFLKLGILANPRNAPS